jgi:hypothetical protein
MYVDNKWLPNDVPTIISCTMTICFERFPKWSKINPPFIDAHLLGRCLLRKSSTVKSLPF